MSSGISLLFLGEIVISLLLFVDSSLMSKLNEYLYHQCADDNDLCNPAYKAPCCNQSLVCKLVDSYNQFKCTDRAQLGQFCKTDNDCKYIPHAECSLRNRCVCKVSIVVDNNVICGLPLGEICKDQESCGPDNSICFDNRCECNDGYLPLNNRRCLPSKYING
ncbi:uncharacterized protein LOC130667229 [Microplitis mediator]|uniref:uncharacterized protein LOC130667229 n=1 Tax=Microplitis mediator TaxID=375433 RepID=UPI002552D75A|nr:uncharacterized protein LOC130667229 [Microplitis mediator]